MSWQPLPGRNPGPRVGPTVAGRAVAGVGAAHPGVRCRSHHPAGAPSRRRRAHRHPRRTLRAHLASSLTPDGDGVDDRGGTWLDQWSLHLGQLSRPLLADGVDRRLGLQRRRQAACSSHGRRGTGRCRRHASGEPWSRHPRLSIRGRLRPEGAPSARRRGSTRRRRSAACPTLPRWLASSRPSQPPARESQVPGHDRRRLLRRASPVRGGHAPRQAHSNCRSKAGVASTSLRRTSTSTSRESRRRVPGSCRSRPSLSKMLRAWVEEQRFLDRRPFFSGPAPVPLPTRSNWARALHRAQRACGCPALRVYDCRHAAATTWLRAGVPLGEVAKRMGHSVETLVSTYAGVLESDEALGNQRISAALASPKKGPIRGAAQARGTGQAAAGGGVARSRVSVGGVGACGEQSGVPA